MNVKKRHRIATLSLAVLLGLCFLLPLAAPANAAEMETRAIGSVVADLSRSGTQLYKYARGSTTNTGTIYYTVVLQQKAVWPWAEYTDYEAYSGKSGTGSFTYGATTSPPTGYYYRVAVYASGAGFSDMEAVSGAIFY